MMKGRYPDLLGLLLYLKKLLDEKGDSKEEKDDEDSRNRIGVTEVSQYDRSQHQSPNRYTMRNQRNESPMRLSMR